jgi:hypothetical protein
MKFILECSVSKMAQMMLLKSKFAVRSFVIMNSNLLAYIFVLCSETKKRLLCYTFLNHM